jgi:hypothetical protein
MLALHVPEGLGLRLADDDLDAARDRGDSVITGR